MLSLDWVNRATLTFLKESRNRSTSNIFLILLKIKKSPLYPEALRFYKSLVAQNNNRVAENELSQSQSDNYATHKELTDLKNRLGDELNIGKTLRTTRISKARLDELSFICYLKLVTEFPPLRNDYSTLMVASVVPTSGNAIVRQNSKWYIVLNDYKTSRAHGQYKEVLPNELSKFITRYVRKLKKNNGSKSLFQKSDGSSYSRNGFVKWAGRHFRETLGKVPTISLIRRAYVNFRFPAQSSLNDRREVARKMAHSVSEQLSTYTIAERTTSAR